MNNPEDIAVDPAEMIEWIKAYRERRSLSWSALAKETGIPSGTLSTMCVGAYLGNLDNQAKRLYKFRQKVESQEVMQRNALAPTAFIETPSARRILTLLEIAHMGRITVAAMGPGNSKTKAAEHYSSSVSSAWHVTMRQSHKTVSAMIAQVMAAMKLSSRSGWKSQRSNQVADFVEGQNGLIIVDEANHLSWESLEELRGWHDVTGVGLALLGNEELMMRIQGGANRHAYARLNSRIAHYHVQDKPTEADVSAYLNAFDIDDPASRRELTRAALAPTSGGLREVKQILEFANMLAIGDEKPLEHEHISQAMQSRATSQMRRAA
jgi:hypothetical protein